MHIRSVLFLIFFFQANFFVFAQKAIEPVDLVYPYLDSSNSRWFFFNSASRPFGMVNLSPDTDIDGAWGSGYRYEIVEAVRHVLSEKVSQNRVSLKE